MTMYQFSDAIRPSEEFRRIVLQLITLIQCSLSLFELFPIEPPEQNGLLCDQTVDGIQKWIVETGEPYMSLEVLDRLSSKKNKTSAHLCCSSLQRESQIPRPWLLSSV